MRRVLFLFALLFLSPIVPAAPVTIGALSSNDDGSTEVIVDSLNGYEWLRWNVLKDLTYAQTVAAITTGAYSTQGWMVAGISEAHKFIDAWMTGVTNSCTTAQLEFTNCNAGNAPFAATDVTSLFGDSYSSGDDNVAWFLSDKSLPVGYIRAVPGGIGAVNSYAYNSWSTIANSDQYSASGVNSTLSIGWLLYREAVVVPAPPSLALFGLGLAGLGWSRRKEAKA